MHGPPTLHGGQVRLGTHFEVVLRLFRFVNQTEGDAYMQSAPPVFYLRASHGDATPLAAARAPAYKPREHPDSVREVPLAARYAAHGGATLGAVARALNRQGVEALQHSPLEFTPLIIKGLDCLAADTECLGDCPDAAYFGPHVQAEADPIQMLRLSSDDEIHVITAVNHRQLKAAAYGSIALLKPHPASSSHLSKARMSVRATSLGVTSFDFDSSADFVSWGFTRSAAHCTALMAAGALDGCLVVDASHVGRDSYLTYCERVYLNPATGTGPSHADLLPARLYTIDLRRMPLVAQPALPSGLPAALPLSKIEDGSGTLRSFQLPTYYPTYFPTCPRTNLLTDCSPGTMRFFHIIKTGGESLELHLDKHPSPRLNYSHCRRAGRASGWQRNLSDIASTPCALAAAGISAALCGLNCECCAEDTIDSAIAEGGTFHGTLLRSPRAFLLSLFTHCHTAHTSNSWSRIADDPPQVSGVSAV